MPPTEETQDTTSLSDDLFNAAFDETVKGEVTDDPTDTKAADDAAAAEATKIADDTKAADDAAAAEAAKIPKVETPAPVDIPAIIAATVAATQKKEEPIVETPAAATPTAEELAAEEQYKKDWPEQYAREQRLKAQLEKVENLLATTTEALRGQLAPVIEQNNLTAEEKHLAVIYGAHSDADTILPDVEKWISEQPKFLQPQYNAVLEKGSAAEIVELFTTYKNAAGVSTPDTSAADAAAAETARLDAEKNERLKKMQTPTSIRTSVTAEEEATDFDSAFDQEAKKYKIAA